jgi:hypothetical protein
MKRSRRRNSRLRRTRKRRMRGGKMTGGCNSCTAKPMVGGFLKSDLVNLGRDFAFGAQSAYRGLMGLNPPINPNPLVQPSVFLGKK